ncbi:MAG: phage holin family protein [Beijerinckiaceae bacterium]|nr:phage holin family protein [Beijerinckiaceae bacterium]
MPDDRFAPRTGAPRAPEQSPGALVSALFTDFSDLVSKEIALAKGELAENMSVKTSGAAWIAVAGVVMLAALMTLIAGTVFLIASFGLALHGSAFIVGGVLVVLGLILLSAGKSKLSGDTLPTRSMTQVQQDVRVVKEQLK